MDGKLRTYSRFKSNIYHENYLNLVKIYDHRSALTRLRTSSHNLMIESGRYSKPNKTPVHERLCKLCKEVEDEMHFLTKCKLHDNERAILFKKVGEKCQNFSTLNDIDKFLYLMASEGEIICETAKFCHSAFELRTAWLHTPIG
jgi:hypothetical protein